MSLEQNIHKLNELEHKFTNAVEQYTNLLPGLSNSTANQVKTIHAGHKFHRSVTMIVDAPLHNGEQLQHFLPVLEEGVNKVTHLTSYLEAWCMIGGNNGGGDIAEALIDCKGFWDELTQMPDKELLARMNQFSQGEPSISIAQGTLEGIKKLMNEEGSGVSGIALASQILQGILLILALITRLKSSEIHTLITLIGTQANTLATSFKTGGELVEQPAMETICKDIITLNSVRIKRIKGSDSDYFFTITLAANKNAPEMTMRLPKEGDAVFPNLDNNNEGNFNFPQNMLLFERISGSCDNLDFVNLTFKVTERDLGTDNGGKNALSFDGKTLKCTRQGNSNDGMTTVEVFEDDDDSDPSNKIAEITFSVKLTKRCDILKGVV